MRYFRGVAHVHSTYSFDGCLTLEELAAFFTQRGIHFALMSEHVESLDSQKVLSFIADCAAYSTDSFLFIPGIEIDALNGLFYNVQRVDGWGSNEDLARQLVAGGAMAAVSHPVKVKKDIPEVTAGVVEGVEVWNSRHDGKMAPNARMIEFWRSLRQRLDRPLIPLCGIDFHQKHDFVPLVFEVECERLSPEVLMAAIRGRRYRIALSRQTIPLNFSTGRLALSYQVYSKLYGWAYAAIYAVHRATLRAGLQPPKRLKAILRRVF